MTEAPGEPAATGLDAALRAAEARAEAAEQAAARLVAYGSLARPIADELTCVLGAIVGNLAEARRGRPVSGEALKAVSDAARAATRLTNQLVFYAQGAAQAVPVDLDAVVSGVVRRCRRRGGDGVRITVETSPGAVRVLADPEQVRLIVAALIENALEATATPGAPGTRVSVRAAPVVVDAAWAAERDVEPGDYVRLVVEDDGAGVAPEHAARLFDPAFSTKGAGRGMGLAAARGAVLGHGGALWFSSAPGDGATFELLLPVQGSSRKAVSAPAGPVAADPELEQALADLGQALDGVKEATGASSPALAAAWAALARCRTAAGLDPASARRTRPGHLLIVDDQLAVMRSTAKLLELEGHTVTVARTGEEALARHADEGPFDAAIVDLVLPGMGGCEVLAALRQHQPELPAVLYSGYGHQADIEQHLNPTTTFLAKPFLYAELLAALARVSPGQR